MTKVYSKKEAAKALRISLPTLNRYMKKGKTPYHKIGDRVVFTESDLTTFLDNCAVPAVVDISEREKLEAQKRAEGILNENPS